MAQPDGLSTEARTRIERCVIENKPKIGTNNPRTNKPFTESDIYAICTSAVQGTLNQKSFTTAKKEFLEKNINTIHPALIDQLPDAAFAFIKPGGIIDQAGRTTPRSLRYLPHHNMDVHYPTENNTVEPEHVINGLNHASQTDMNFQQRTLAIAHLVQHAVALGIGGYGKETKDFIATSITKEKLTVADINNLPDAAFAVIKSGGSKDSEGKTVPRNLRALPHHNSSVTNGNDNSTVDIPHLRNALARLPQADLTPEEKAHAEAHLIHHAKALGVGDYGQKSYFNIGNITKSWKEKSAQGNERRYLSVTITGEKEDRDGERMSKGAVDSIITRLKSGTVPVFSNHGIDKHGNRIYDWKDIMGRFVDAHRNPDDIKNAVGIIELNDANPDSDTIWKYRHEQGMPVGFSIGGKVEDKSITYEEVEDD